MASPDQEHGLSEKDRRIIELTQGFRDLASHNIDTRLAALYSTLNGEMHLMNSYKTLSVRDQTGILTSYEVATVLRRFLLEDNEAGNLDIEVHPPHPGFSMVVRNPSTKNMVLIGSDIRPYALPMLSNDTRSRPLTPVAEDAAQYAVTIRGDEHVVGDFNAAKKLIGAVKQIAGFEGKLAL